MRYPRLPKRLIGICLVVLPLSTARHLYGDSILLSQTAKTFTAADEGSYSVGSPYSLAVSWSLSTAFKDVDISTRLIGDAVGTAYLMTKIGPNATTADQLMSSTFRLNSSAIVWMPVFTDLTLQPGTYYLVLGSHSCCFGWG